MTPLEQILDKLDHKRSGSGWAAKCPAHGDDRSHHLTIHESNDGRVLMHCHKGCTFLEICNALEIEPKDTFPRPIGDEKRQQYHVRDHTGRVTAIHHRENTPDGKKKVWWTEPDGKTTGLGGLKGESLPLWGAESVSSVPFDRPIVVCEGEKSAYALSQIGVPAVATVTGASGTPGAESLAVLKGRKVILWPDNDDPGRQHMQRIGKGLQGIAAGVKVLDWRDTIEGGDAADHPAVTTGAIKDLKVFLGTAEPFFPPHDVASDGAANFGYAQAHYETLLARRRASGGITGYRTGIPRIDRGIHGLNDGESILIAARPNVGKSLLAGQIALTAAQNGVRTLLQTPEMSAVQYLDRFACRMADVNYFDVQDGRFTDLEARHLMQAASVISDLPLLVDDFGSQTVDRVRQNIETHEAELLVVDYLQFMTPDDPRANRNQQVGQISRDLARLKKDYNIPVVLACQLNRGSENRAGREPILTDLRDSGEIEQDADIVLMLHRPEMNDTDTEPEDETVQVFCRKNRMGQLWFANLHFVPGQQWLVDTYDAVTGKGVDVG